MHVSLPFALFSSLFLLIASSTNAATILVKPDGTGDQPTIQDALNNAGVGDVILLDDGVFSGPGNQNFGFTNTLVTMMSANGPKATILDAGGTSRHCSNPGGAGSTVIGITFRNGSTTSGGGSIDTDNTDMLFENCVWENNSAVVSGGALRLRGSSSPTFRNCTFVGNSAPTGNDLHMFGGGSSATIEKCIFAFGTGAGAPVACGGGTSMACTNLFGNAGGNAVCGVDLGNNFSADPLFCGGGNYAINSASPCATNNSPCGELIGACVVGCGAVPTETASWGRIKALY